MLKPNVIIDTTDTTDSTDTSDTVIYIRKILLEDYTGHRCGNCPRSHEKLQELLNVYGIKIVPLCVHAGFFAMPMSQYTADYRTSTGNDLNTYFGNSNAGLPNGMVNRTELDGNVIIQHSNWEQVIQGILLLEPEMDIKIVNDYNSTSNTLKTDIKLTSLNEFSQTLKLAVYLKEDSIVSFQTDYDHDPQDISDYIHRHVLRDAINSTWGDLVSDQIITVNQTINFSYYYTLNSSWQSSKCSVVAYVYDDETKQIIQAEEIKVTN
jgi:hypothetical protein